MLAPYAPIIIALTTVGVALSGGQQLNRVEWFLATGLTILVLARQLLVLAQLRARLPIRHPAAADPAPARQHASAGMTADTRHEMQALTLQMVAAARPTPRARAQRATGSLVIVLTTIAGLLAVWDLALLIRSAGAGAA